MFHFPCFLLATLYFALPLASVYATQTTACDNATEAEHNAACWASLGYNSWFETWKGPCPGSASCTCDARKPWSDCILNQYNIITATENSTAVTCTDLSRPESCQILSGDWTKLTENQLALAYVSTAINNLFHFVHGWYAAITAGPTPSAILDLLSNRMSNLTQSNNNDTSIDIASFLSALMTQDDPGDATLPVFKDIIDQVIGKDDGVDIRFMDIGNFQSVLGTALNRTLNAIISDWSTPYFGCLGQDGGLIGNISRNVSLPVRDSDQTSPIQPFNSTNLTFSAGTDTRTLLSIPDATQMWGYDILSCDASEPNGLASELITFLDTFHNNLFEVMLATSKGPRSPLGFPQIFKTKQWLPIRRLYEYMHNAVGTAGNLAANPLLPDNRPVLICLQPHKRETRAAYAVCEDQPRLRAFQQPGAPHAIGLCPSFWALPVGPVRAFCPWKGELSADYIGDALLLNQQSVLVSLLVRLYLGGQVLELERFRFNEVLALESGDAYRNPSSWAYWFASAIGCSPSSWKDPDL